MSELKIATRDNRTVFRPGEEIAGAAGWKLERAPQSISVNLLWRTEGKGDSDSAIVRSVSFEAPEAPVSFSGKLISLIWSLELVVLPGDESARIDLVLSPVGQEILLGTVKDETRKRFSFRVSRR
jgi:hypothetical protein